MGLKEKKDGEFVEVGPPVSDTPGTVLTSGENGKPEWKEPKKSTFRGAWSSGVLAKQYDFTDGTLPDEFSWTGVGIGTHGVNPITVALLGGGGPNGANMLGTPGPYASAMSIEFNAIGPTISTDLALDLSKLHIPGIISVSAWMSQASLNGDVLAKSQHQMRRNGASIGQWGPNHVAWTKRTTDATSSDIIHFQAFGTYGGAPELSGKLNVGLTGIEIYSVADPYMTGEFVTHAGEMWRSLVNNNAQVPSKTATQWERAITLPAPSGTTANRPSASLAGAGFQYFDTSLNKPTWSTGNGWIDATGTAV